MTELLTVDQLRAFAPHCDAEILAPAMSSAASERQISTPLRISHFLAQFAVETQAFTVFVENLRYTAARLCKVWPSRFPTLAKAQPYANDPQKLAERVYGNRMGNVAVGDGWRYRGRGGGLTGRENYARYGAMLGLDLIGNPDLAAWPVHAPRIAAAFWSVHNLNPVADQDDIAGVTEAWNGGLTGLDDRKAALAKAKHVLGVA